MSERLFLSLSQVRLFWRLRALVARVSFWAESKIFGVRYSLKEEKTNCRSLYHLLRLTVKPLFVAIGAAAICQYVDPFLLPYYRTLGIAVPDDGDYVTFFAAVSSIGGVFIGLYYAGISAVGGAIYATVPNNLRELLAYERRGNVYMGYLAFLTFFCLTLIAIRLTGFPRLYIAVPLVATLAGIGIFAFVKLGQQAFYFFDPTTLSGHIFEQLQHSLQTVMAGGYRWQDKAFQRHAYRQASSVLDTLDTLSDFTASKPHLRGTSFISLSENLLRFLIRYEYTKRHIPSDSLWYGQRYEHRDWYRTEDSRVSIAHMTGTTLQPDVIVDKEWVESRVVPIIKKCIETNVHERRYDDIHALLGYADAYVKVLAKEGAVERAFNFLGQIALVVMAQFAQDPIGKIVESNELEKLGVIERLSSLPISIALGYRTLIKDLDRTSIKRKMSSVHWDANKDIYEKDFPTYCLGCLEWFRPRLEFERRVEGQDVTPLWYQTELICQIECDQFAANAKALLSKGIRFYKEAIAKALGYKHLWLAAAIMSREWEYWHKVDNQIDIWQKKWPNLSGNRHIEGLPWSEFDAASLRSDSKQRQHELLKLMSQQSTLLSLLKRPEGYPDYAGQFLHTAGEVSLDALLSNDPSLLESTFEPYLHGCLLRFDSLRPKGANTDWRAQRDFKVAAAALLDVMDVSGYAKLLSDFHGNNTLWKSVTSAWNAYLAKNREQSPLPLLAIAIAFTEAAFEIPHRAVLRTTWQQKVEHKLAVVPRHEVFHRGSLSSEIVIDHDSALIRLFAQEPYGSFHDGIDVFIAYYMRDVEGGAGLDFGTRRHDLRESIELEQHRNRREDGNDRGKHEEA
ncbi:MAG TPA: hypothetical protein VJS89_00785 [Gammaproteobacteria bacterium]|nr:hypothetical protein [Gammaproteobacteria bacterium]